MTVLSVFGASPPPGTLGIFTDNPPSITPGGRFYRYAGLADASIVGGRVFVPAPAPGSTAVRIMLWLTGDMTTAPDREVTVTLQGTGWQEGTFSTPAPIPAQGVAFRVGYQFVGNPATYIYAADFRADLSELPIHPLDNGITYAELRSIFRDGTGPEQMPGSYGVFYGVDVLVDDGQGGPVDPPPNVAPVARAGADKAAASGASVSLSGSASTDADGALVSYTWSQVAGPVVTLSGTGAGRTFIAPVGPAVLTFQLTVTDDDGATSADTVVVTVAAPPEPEPTGPVSDLLSAADLAYMRETQTGARPTEAELVRQTQGTTPSGGRSNVPADPVPIQVRLDGKEKAVPQVVTGLVGSAKAVKVVTDLVDIRVGDIIRVGATDYQVVTDPDPDEWVTAQVVWTKKVKGPARG